MPPHILCDWIRKYAADPSNKTCLQGNFDKLSDIGSWLIWIRCKINGLHGFSRQHAFSTVLIVKPPHIPAAYIFRDAIVVALVISFEVEDRCEPQRLFIYFRIVLSVNPFPFSGKKDCLCRIYTEERQFQDKIN